MACNALASAAEISPCRLIQQESPFAGDLHAATQSITRTRGVRLVWHEGGKIFFHSSLLLSDFPTGEPSLSRHCQPRGHSASARQPSNGSDLAPATDACEPAVPDACPTLDNSRPHSTTAIATYALVTNRTSLADLLRPLPQTTAAEGLIGSSCLHVAAA